MWECELHSRQTRWRVSRIQAPTLVSGAWDSFKIDHELGHKGRQQMVWNKALFSGPDRVKKQL